MSRALILGLIESMNSVPQLLVQDAHLISYNCLPRLMTAASKVLLKLQNSVSTDSL